MSDNSETSPIPAGNASREKPNRLRPLLGEVQGASVVEVRDVNRRARLLAERRLDRGRRSCKGSGTARRTGRAPRVATLPARKGLQLRQPAGKRSAHCRDRPLKRRPGRGTNEIYSPANHRKQHRWLQTRSRHPEECNNERCDGTLSLPILPVCDKPQDLVLGRSGPHHNANRSGPHPPILILL